MSRNKFPLTYYKDERITELIKETGHKTLGIWAIDCAERVLPYFEEQHAGDNRPRIAIETLRAWVSTGIFKMSVIRGASLAAHAAAREAEEDSAARSAARSAGQAAATAHVPAHAMGAAIYALQAIHKAANFTGTAAAMEQEWQFRRLQELKSMETDCIYQKSEGQSPGVSGAASDSR